jgi:hypothetical protein
MICLKAPELRMLKEDYGNSYHNNYMVGAEELHSESITDDPESQIPAVGNLGTLPDDVEDEDGATLQAANTSMVMSMSHDDSTTDSYRAADPPSSSYVEYPGSESFQAELAEDFSTYPIQRMVSDETDDDVTFDEKFMDMSSSGPRAASENREAATDPPADAELHALAAKVGDETDEELDALAAKVAPWSQNDSNLVGNSDDLIDKCVTELEESFKK